jgi:hypothetical protein
MTVHIFTCSTRQTRKGLTPDRTGGNLPATSCQGGNWKFFKTIEVNPEEPGRIGALPAVEILAAIARDGYAINDITIEISESQL